MQNHLVALIRESPHYRQVFNRARASRARVTSVYDISSRCNLFCEGCLFFTRDGDFEGEVARPDPANYERLFASEKTRGVTYPVFGGAEPSLEPRMLQLAARHWTNGMLHTNGIKAIDPALPFRLYVSVWGQRERTRKWRGADCYEKTLDTVTHDPRVIMNYTISSQNIGDLLPVVQDCHDRALPITFQFYSPTRDYSDYLTTGTGNDHRYIQGAAPDDNLVLTQGDLTRAEAAICEAINRFPDTVLFTRAMARWVCAAPVTFPGLGDDAAIPAACFAGNDPRHRHHLNGGRLETRKTCGHPSVTCRTCKTYTSMYPAFFAEKLSARMTRQDAIDFLDAHEVFDTIYEGRRRAPARALRGHEPANATPGTL